MKLPEVTHNLLFGCVLYFTASSFQRSSSLSYISETVSFCLYLIWMHFTWAACGFGENLMLCFTSAEAELHQTHCWASRAESRLAVQCCAVEGRAWHWARGGDRWSYVWSGWRSRIRSPAGTLAADEHGSTSTLPGWAFRQFLQQDRPPGCQTRLSLSLSLSLSSNHYIQLVHLCFSTPPPFQTGPEIISKQTLIIIKAEWFSAVCIIAACKWYCWMEK